MKKILITGSGSYIGTSFETYVKQWSDKYQVDTLDMIGDDWKKYDFSGYDTVYHVAGIAHSDNGKISKEKAKLYYEVNTKLTIQTAMKAKKFGVKQFIFMSSAIVYGDSAPIGRNKMITKETPVSPTNCYGDSKVKAENGLRKLEDKNFKIVILRPPMIYGKGSKGNYPLMSKLAKKMPVFPYVKNCRSMLYIENLCEFVRLMIENEENGTFWPQNKEYSNTSELVKMIAGQHGKKTILIKGCKIPLKILGLTTNMVDKAFGNLCYSKEISTYPKANYQKYSLVHSIYKTEKPNATNLMCNTNDNFEKYSVLMSVYYKEKPEYLNKSIESMMNQTLSPEQIVIVEDGLLNNDLEEIINNYKNKYPELFTIIKLSKNGGLGNALNTGLKYCRNEFVARMDSDDISLPERCKKEINEFKADPSLTIVGSQINEFIDNPKNIISSRIVPTEYQDIKRFARRRSPFNHPTVMYRKSVILSLKGYQTSGRKEDLDLFIRLLNNGYNAKNLDEVLLMYRSNTDNLLRRKSWKNCSEYINIMYGFYKKGYCGFLDLLYVVLGQTAMFVTPLSVTAFLSKKFLRK